MEQRLADPWAHKDSWRLCTVAIGLYPKIAAPPCAALHLCANEAPLTHAERARLAEMFRADPSCPPP